MPQKAHPLDRLSNVPARRDRTLKRKHTFALSGTRVGVSKHNAFGALEVNPGAVTRASHLGTGRYLPGTLVLVPRTHTVMIPCLWHPGPPSLAAPYPGTRVLAFCRKVSPKPAKAATPVPGYWTKKSGMLLESEHVPWAPFILIPKQKMPFVPAMWVP
eukprot:1606621-Rhodomonas_salina.2